MLRHLASLSPWSGEMHYAAGPDMAAAPFTLSGSIAVAIDCVAITLRSYVVLPSGKERSVVMRGTLDGPALRLEPADSSGPISLLLSEPAGSRTILIREFNRTSGAVVLSGSMVLADERELVQTAHELVASPEAGGEVGGVQMWRMRPASDVRVQPVSLELLDRGDPETFMWSGSEL